jgi:hypothetical protein
MAPGDELPVDFELVVPAGATPGDYNAVIFFEMFEFDQGNEGSVSRVSGRIGARIDLRVVGEIVDDITLSDLSARTFVIGDTTPFAVRVSNDGNIDKKIDVRLVLLGAGESEEWSQVLEEQANVYAQRERFYDGAVAFDGVGFGRYTFQAVMDYNKEVGDGEGTVIPETDTVERELWVIPLWLAITALVIVGIPLVYLTYRISTRGAREGREPSRRKRRSDRGTSASTDRRETAADTGDSGAAPGKQASVADSAPDAGIADGQDELWASESMFEDDD